MNKFVVLVLAVVALAALANAELKVLTDENFDQTNEGTWLIKFYAPWCGHCKRLAPTWDELAEVVGSNWNVAKVDCTVHSAVCNAQEIRGYPTLKLFRNGGEGVKYAGAREIPAFIKWVEEQYPDVPKTAYTPKNAPAETPAATAAPAAAAAAPSDVIELTDSTFEPARKGIWMVEFYAPWCGHCKKMVPSWEEFATKAKGHYNVAKVDVTKESALAKEFGIKSMPTIKLLVDGAEIPFNGPRTVPDWIKFVEDATGKKIEGGAAAAAVPAAAAAAAPAAVPAAVPAAAASGEVTKDEGVSVLTVGNFDAETKGKDYFIEFYAPWCGHCKRLVPTWSELATTTKFNVGKVDCTIETALKDKYAIRGFPTLKLFKADGTIVDYSGARTIEAFTTFLNDNVGQKAHAHGHDEL